jgi:hypothetical protein
MVVDAMYFSKSIPLVAVERSMPFAELAKARRSHPEPPPWGALFAKAFGLAAREYAELRQTYFSFPFPYLYEYEESAVGIAHELTLGEELVVLLVRIRNPDKMPLIAFRYKIAEVIDAERQRGFYGRFALVSYLPFFLRRPLWWLTLNVPRFRKRFCGTFAITSVGSLGADLLTPRAPVTSLLTYGPLGDDGKLKVRLLFDHRVYDGATAARVLARIEEILLGPIFEEIKYEARMAILVSKS